MNPEELFKNRDRVVDMFKKADKVDFKGFTLQEELTIRLLMQILLTK